MNFRFSGKSGVKHAIELNDRRLARIVKRCLDVPGYELFQYIDHDGSHHSVDAGDVNDYLRAISERPFTAKDFRTWAGTVLACAMLREFEGFASETEAKKNVVRAIASVAQRLGNTPSVCRKCYVHPAVIESYLGGDMFRAFEARVKGVATAHAASRSKEALRDEEMALIRLLEQRVHTDA
jgi:DNA topoisomerase-1